MYRMVIADDEPFIIQLIEKLIDYNRLAVEIVGTTTNGAAALELVREKKPDILITDIKMPCMDGLELIEELKKENISIPVIAISGYRRFDYAYGAIKGGVENYLVKPINRKELNDALERVIGRIITQRDESEAYTRMQKKVEHGTLQLRDRLISDILGDPLFTAPIEQINRNYLCEFRAGVYLGVVIQIDVPHMGEVFDSLSDKCNETIDKILGELSLEKQFSWVDNCLCGLINMPGEAIYQLRRRIKMLFTELCVCMDFYEKVSVSICLGNIEKYIENGFKSLREAKTGVRAKCVLGGNQILECAQMDWNDAHNQLHPEQISALRRIMEVCQIDQLRSWLRETFPQSDSYYLEHPLKTLSMVDAVVNNFMMLCEMLAIKVDSSTAEICINKINTSCGLKETLCCLLDFMQVVLAQDMKQREQSASYCIQRAKEYIAQNLGNAIRLEHIAEHVSLSPNYFSMLFKKETGQNPSDYIVQQRLEKAKLLLRTTNLNLSQIAQQVGYTDAKHFSKLFKRFTGTFPKDYRKMYLR